MNNRLIKSNNAGGGGGGCTDTVDLYNPFPDGGGVALYQLNGDATDESGNYNGTASNVTYGTGVFGQAGFFNGSNSRVAIPNVVNQAANHSVSIWIKPTNFSVARAAMSMFNGSHLMIYVTTDAGISTDGSSTGQGTTAGTITADAWNNVTVTYNYASVTYTIYVNGINRGTGINFNFSGRPNSIGCHNNGSSFVAYFNGSIDQVRIFNRALRPYEVESLYTEQYCTPTIVPSEHFNTVLYTGNGGTQSVSGAGFQPDFTWIKTRDQSIDHILTDSVRGVSKSLFSNLTNAESNFAGNGLNAFNSDGFTVTDLSGNNYGVNGSSKSFVAWNFKAGGAAVSNTDGTITSQVSANVEAGFSIVSWTGNGSGLTVGHGLGIAPKITIRKKRNNTGGWPVIYDGSIVGGSGLRFMELNTTAAQQVAGQQPHTDTTFGLFNGFDNTLNATWIAYCFAEVEGFSSFGSYVGKGASVSVVTGFEPAFVMIKRTDAAEWWNMIDNKRNPSNPVTSRLFANLSNSEINTNPFVNFLENGFEIIPTNNGSVNTNGGSFIYMAFAADPTTVEPTLADSFNTVTYTGTGSQITRTDVGFQPDLVWVKGRDDTWDNFLTNSITNGALRLNKTLAETPNPDFLFNSDGFTTPLGGSWTQSGQGYVAWAWKGAEIPAINSNGSIKSVVSANPAAGFSIVSYTGNLTSGATVGHSLENAPKMIITKRRDTASQWCVYNQSIGGQYGLFLNLTNAKQLESNLWNNTDSNDSVFSLGNSSNTNGGNMIAYCFAEVAGFSKFGSYTGTQTTNNPTIDCGFEPAFVMIKCSSQAMNWAVFDNKRDTTNPNNAVLYPNLSLAETNSSSTGINFLSNGFQINSNLGGWINTSGANFIYMAFANQF